MQARWPIDAVVFDLGGVLLDWDPRHLYRKLFADDAAMECFLGELCTPEWHHAHDRGVSTAESCAALALRHPRFSQLIWAWSERSEEMVAGDIPGSVDVLRDVKRTGLPCYALTNMEAETYPLRRERFPFLGWFDGTVVSGREGVCKPDPEIFLRLLRALHPVALDDADDRRQEREPRRRPTTRHADGSLSISPARTVAV